MKKIEAKFRDWPVTAGFLLSPFVAWAHDPHGWGIATLGSLPFVFTLGIILARVGWKLGLRFTSHRSKRVSFIVSLLAAMVAVVVSFLSFPFFFLVIYWAYDSFF